MSRPCGCFYSFSSELLPNWPTAVTQFTFSPPGCIVTRNSSLCSSFQIQLTHAMSENLSSQGQLRIYFLEQFDQHCACWTWKWANVSGLPVPASFYFMWEKPRWCRGHIWPLGSDRVTAALPPLTCSPHFPKTIKKQSRCGWYLPHFPCQQWLKPWFEGGYRFSDGRLVQLDGQRAGATWPCVALSREERAGLTADIAPEVPTPDQIVPHHERLF